MPDYSSYPGAPWDSQRDKIKKVIIENGVTNIGSYAFNGCVNFTSITIPNSVTSIGFGAFNDCWGLTSVTIPSSVTSIGPGAFSNCDNLVDLKYNVIKVASCQFPVSIKTVTIGNEVEVIPSHFLEGNTNVASIKIPGSVTSIGERSFSGCSGLISVTIPNSVTSIGNYAFSNCNGLTSVNITDLVSWCKINFNNYNSNPLYYAKHLYLNGNEVENLVIPNEITRINNLAFYGCSGLTSVTIPNSVTSIGERSFYD